jgi:acetoin utilization deacetylase AcuC-like enzyme
MPTFNIPVYYRAEMVATTESFSPSAGKPAAVMADWRRHGFPIEELSFEPVDAATLALAHDGDWVRRVLACKAPNGFNNRSAAIAASLPFTNGAMLAAARAALANGRVAAAPVSGFHHAGYGAPGGFCTFNGLMVTALAMKRDQAIDRLGILDLDQHYGDGTDDIIDTLAVEFIRHVTAGKVAREARQAPAFLAELPSIVRGFSDCDLLLYQAGADPHVEDPLGGWMSTAQLAQRDRIVFETAADMGLPVAWDLAGGYQRDAGGGIEPVLEIHRNTMRACVAVHGAAG